MSTSGAGDTASSLTASKRAIISSNKSERESAMLLYSQGSAVKLNRQNSS